VVQDNTDLDTHTLVWYTTWAKRVHGFSEIRQKYCTYQQATVRKAKPSVTHAPRFWQR